MSLAAQIPQSLLLLNLYSPLPSGQLPPEIQRKNEQLQQLSPRLQIHIFNEHDILAYLKEHAPQWLRVYQLINPEYAAAQADFFRYVYIYLNGGLYLDIKSGFDTCPFERIKELNWPATGLYVSHWDNHLHKSWGKHSYFEVDRELVVWFILAEPKNLHLAAVIREMCWNIVTYDRLSRGVGDAGVLQTTGPIMYSKALLPRLKQSGINLIDYQELGLYPSIYERQEFGLSKDHLKMYRKHYSTLNTPVISSSWGKRIRAIYAHKVK